MMRLILDANSIIYLVKTNLFIRFTELTSCPIVIDTAVYKEVIEDGISKNYPDAYIAKKLIQDFEVEVIPQDIRQDLPLFRDPGETSCYLLAKDSGICITSDRKAVQKMLHFGITPISIDEYFYNLCLHKFIEFNEFETNLMKLEKVHASTKDRILFFTQKIQLNQIGDKL